MSSWTDLLVAGLLALAALLASMALERVLRIKIASPKGSYRHRAMLFASWCLYVVIILVAVVAYLMWCGHAAAVTSVTNSI